MFMRLQFVLIVVVLLVVPGALGDGTESEPLGWAQSAGGFESDFIGGHVVLHDGTVIVAGKYYSAIQFGENGIGATNFAGDVDMYLAQINSTGNWTNYVGFGSTGEDSIDAIALHTSGDIIIAGHYCLGTAGESCEINFSGGFTFSKAADGDEGNAFVGRFSTNSSGFFPVWIRSIGNQNDLSSLDVSVSTTGEISAAILHTGMLEVEGEIIPGAGGQSIAIINFDENGGVLWTNGVSSPVGIEPFGGLCHSPDGSLNVVGTFLEAAMFIEMIASLGGSDFFVAQLDSIGNWSWILTAGGIGDDWVNDCAVDSDGQVRLVGQFEQTATFDHINVTATGWWDMFHARTTSSGAWDSVIIAGSGGWETLESIVVDSMDNAYVIGSYTTGFSLGLDNLPDLDSNGDKRDIVIAQMDSNDEWKWAVSAGGIGDDRGLSIQLGIDDSPVAGMTFSNTSNFGNFTLNSAQNSVDIALWLYERDQDGDGFTDGIDNCPRDANPEQTDTDNNGLGNACDDDDDGDGIGDEWDDCTPGEIDWYSSAESDHDTDGCRDAGEDFDDDEDGILDHLDACPKGPVGWISTLENDEDQDGCEDIDTDGDGFVDQFDICPDISDDQSNLDNDSFGDACDDDIDGDGVPNAEDNCPTDQYLWNSSNPSDYDSDGCRDADADADDDEDGVLDLYDACPYGEMRWNASEDYDGDGCRDGLEDLDEDNDGYNDDVDNCPNGIINPAGIGMDIDQDGCIDSSEDIDDDNDGVTDDNDDCKYTPTGVQIDAKGCSDAQLDDDNDGVSNQDDLCPSSTAGVIVYSTGCEVVNNMDNPDNPKSNNDDPEESSSSLTLILFVVAGLLVAGAAYLAWNNSQSSKDDTEPQKVAPALSPEIENEMQSSEVETVLESEIEV